MKLRSVSLKKNSNNLVFSDGDFNSPVMIVGEGPGQREDELREAICRRSRITFK